MNTNTNYVCYIIHKQASVNKFISKQVKKSPTENLKNHLWRSSCAVMDILKIQLFHRYFWNILPKHSRTLTVRSTPFGDICLKFRTIFHKIVTIFLGRNKPNNNSFSMLQTNKLKRSRTTVVEVCLFWT